MEYKGYIGKFSFDEKKHIFYGKVSNVKNSITFQWKSIETLRYHFRDAVNDYLAWCLKHGKAPGVPQNDNSDIEDDLDIV